MTETTKPVWQTDRDGFLIGPAQADQSPLEPGVWMIPAGCVEVEPPEIDRNGNHWPRWTGDKWKMIRLQREDSTPEPSPAEKLAAFIAANPDVKAIING